MRILFITSTRIGDAVLSTGILNHLLQQYPQAKFTIVAGEVSAPLFEAFPNLDRLIPLKKQKFSLHWAKLWLEVFYLRWDMVVDLRRSLISYMLMCKESYVASKAKTDEHKVESLARILNLPEPPAPVLWTNNDHKRKAKRLVPTHSQILALGPTANWWGKQWPLDRFVRLAKKLTSSEGLFANARIAILGSPSERVMIKGMVDLLPNTKAIDLVGQADLLTVFEILKRCDFYIGNDSGLMHMAAAAGIPTLGLFGPSREENYAPWGEKGAAVRTDLSFEEIVAAPSYNRKIAQSYMKSLSVEKVEKAVHALYQKTHVLKVDLPKKPKAKDREAA